MDDESAEISSASGEQRAAEARRDFLSSLSSLAMLGGLAAGYGTFFTFAGQFLFPSRQERIWLFAAQASQIPPGESATFVTPSGAPVVIKRRAASDAKSPPLVDDFVALSSTCPHLGCRVHWEGQHHRFFCPCHNGAFDAEGRPTGGPPLAAGQHLPRYPLRLEGELLFIELPAESIGKSLELTDCARPAPGDGLCLAESLPRDGGRV